MKVDIGNQFLFKLLAVAAAVLVVYVLAFSTLGPAWRAQGGPMLYLIAVAGAALLLVSVVFLIAKRVGVGSPRVWFIAHVVAATVGFVLVSIHAAGSIFEAPALLLLALVGLMALGVWARVRAANMMAGTFATKRGGFVAADPELTDRLTALIEEKRAVLAQLDPSASEALFSVTLGHWLRRPGLAMAYHKLARAEEGLVGARQSVGAAQAWWRSLHMALAGIFIAGLITHIVVVTFFAGYVAEGRDIYWWHLAAW
jgi:hypothetical protein